ncbi:hypothetical protein GCM10009530_67700 [Microbispora corallina]|uniref:DUF3073 domain-containing protein n=1 Tax=Microbispora corallina TaxID=83302 RepID=A0ABQ4G9L1_9ACTN|nr:DUF3073 domain-containing protein [Microbispora corallina]GIH43771.1 hypothetical protein Mco01_67710 [Microbispora corallina]
MGRGRAKAKQVKVARQLKYNSGGTDLERLRAELGVVDEDDSGHNDEHDPYEELADRYADYAVDDDDDGDSDRHGRR